MMFYVIALLGSLSVLCVALAGFWIVRGRRRRLQGMLQQRLGDLVAQAEVKITRAGLDEGGGIFGTSGTVRWLNRLLVQSGMDLTLNGFLLLIAGVLGGAFLFGALVTAGFAGGLVFALGAAFVLYTVVNGKRERRLSSFDAQLPKAIELMMVGLRAGHTLEDSIRFAADELQPPLSVELKQVYAEYELGRPVEEALTRLASRLSACRALRIFVESVLILKQTGGNLIEIMERIIDSLRAQAAYEARFRALTSEGRTSGMIIGALPLLILAGILIIERRYFEVLVVDSHGWVVILLAGSLWVTGVLWLVRLTRPVV
jgi:tight adherence protein B